MSKSVIVFLPETGMYPYLRTLSLCASSLKKDGYDVYVVDCNGCLPRCIMEAAGHSTAVGSIELRHSLCEQCKKKKCTVMEKYSFKSLSLSKYIFQEDKQIIDSLFTIPKTEWSKIEYDNFKVGQIAIHDLMIETKVLSTENLTETQQILYKKYIMTMCYIISAVNEIISKMHPEIFITFNPYCQNQAVLHCCKKNNIIYKSITGITHLGSNYAGLQISNSTFTLENRNNVQNFDCLIPISSKNVLRNYQDSLYRMFQTGSHIFSSQKKDTPEVILKKLKIAPHKKIVVAFTGSYDERLGIDIYLNAWGTPLKLEEIFKNQIEWLLYLCKMAKEDDSVQYLFRIHPREGRNGGSVHLKMLRETFKSVPENVQVIWPETPVSSYDLLEIMDLCLISTSTMGIECNRVGIPTMSYTRNLSYPNEAYIPIPRTKEEYKRTIYELLNKKVTINDFVLASRFYNWKTFIPCVDMEGEIQKDFDDSNYWPQCPRDWQRELADIIEGKEDIFEHNIKLLKESRYSEDEELTANYEGIKCLILAFMLTDKLFKPNFINKVICTVILLLLRIRRKFFKIPFSNACFHRKDFFHTVLRYRVTIVNKPVFTKRLISLFKRKTVYIYLKDNLVSSYYRGHKIIRFSPLLYKLGLLYKENKKRLLNNDNFLKN